MPSTFAFAPANSSSVNKPCACKPARRWISSDTSEPPPAGAAGAAGGAYCCGGGAYCCCGGGAYCCFCLYACAASCVSHRRAWRRDTRLDTAVAVPAMTAVRAIPLISPISGSFPSCRLEGLADVCDDLRRHPHLIDELATGVAHGRDERDRPEVLDSDNEDRASVRNTRRHV